MGVVNMAQKEYCNGTKPSLHAYAGFNKGALLEWTMLLAILVNILLTLYDDLGTPCATPQHS